jgi:hypothetical protein
MIPRVPAAWSRPRWWRTGCAVRAAVAAVYPIAPGLGAGAESHQPLGLAVV